MKFARHYTGNLHKYRKAYFVLIMAITYILAVRILLIFSYNVDLDGAEFTFIHYIQQLLDGRPLYMDPSAHPYSIVIYTPLYLYTVFGICKGGGLNAILDIHNIYIIGRIVSFLFVIISLVYISKFVQKTGGQMYEKLYSILIFLIFISGHAYAVRPDSMKIACFIAFLYYYLDYFYYSKKNTSFVVSFVLSLLAIVSKQDAIIYILLLQVVNSCILRNKKSFLFLGISVAGYALLFSGLYFTFGEYCLPSLINFNLQVISDVVDSYNLIVVIVNFIRFLPAVLLLVYIFHITQNRKNAQLIRMLSISGFISFFISSFLLFRPGSYINYTYELAVILVFCLAIILTAQPSSTIKKSLGYYVALLFIGNLLVNSYTLYQSKEKDHKEKFSGYYKMREDLLAIHPGNEKIFSPDMKPSIFFSDLNVVYGQEYHLDRLVYSIIGLTCTSHLLFNSSTAYDQQFSNGSIRYILAADKTETQFTVKKYYPHYRLEKKLDGFLLYTYDH